MTFSLTTLYGSNFEGGHFSRGGNAANGTGVRVPLYRHEVSPDYARVEVGLQYTVAPSWHLITRIPWEIKDQQAAIALVDSATPDDRAAMQRNIDIHHRSVMLRGIGDLRVLGRRRWSNRWREDDALSV